MESIIRRNIMKTGFAKTAICIMITMALFACSKGGSDNTSGGGTIGSYTVGENGTASSPWGDGSASQHPSTAVKFTPSSYPVTIKSVTIYAVNNTGMDQMFNLYGFSDLSAETDMFSPVLNQSIPDNGSTSCSSSYEKTVTIPATTITSGSFYIAMEWVTKPLGSASGTNSFFLCTDSSLDYINTNFMRFETSWETYESLTATGGDMGIIVNY
jgi:hypothetical protein